MVSQFRNLAKEKHPLNQGKDRVDSNSTSADRHVCRQTGYLVVKAVADMFKDAMTVLLHSICESLLDVFENDAVNEGQRKVEVASTYIAGTTILVLEFANYGWGLNVP